RRRHTRSKRDWSSDVCSSDLHHLSEIVALLDYYIRASFAAVASNFFHQAQTCCSSGNHSCRSYEHPLSTPAPSPADYRMSYAVVVGLRFSRQRRRWLKKPDQKAR